MEKGMSRTLLISKIVFTAVTLWTPAMGADDRGYKTDGRYHCGSNCGYKADGQFHCDGDG
jgi:hypothetical protein